MHQNIYISNLKTLEIIIDLVLIVVYLCDKNDKFV